MAGGNLNMWGGNSVGNGHIEVLHRVVRVVGEDFPTTRIPIQGLDRFNPVVYTANPWDDGDTAHPEGISDEDMYTHFNEIDDDIRDEEDPSAANAILALSCDTIGFSNEGARDLGEIDDSKVKDGFSITPYPLYDSERAIKAYAESLAADGRLGERAILLHAKLANVTPEFMEQLLLAQARLAQRRRDVQSI